VKIKIYKPPVQATAPALLRKHPERKGENFYDIESSDFTSQCSPPILQMLNLVTPAGKKMWATRLTNRAKLPHNQTEWPFRGNS